jgi:RNA polymerase sigma-70 factor (ECF subfamily)
MLYLCAREMSDLPSEPQPRVTRLLEVINAGDAAASAQLLELVYAELHRLASRYMRSERSDHTLQPTALVHEVYPRLFGGEKPVSLKNSAHFFAVAAMQMRRVLVDHARQNVAQKRRGINISLDEAYHIFQGRDAELIALADALKELAEIDTEAARVVELRFFGGYTDKETAEITGKNVAKIRRDWDFARSWLLARLDETG